MRPTRQRLSVHAANGSAAQSTRSSVGTSRGAMPGPILAENSALYRSYLIQPPAAFPHPLWPRSPATAPIPLAPGGLTIGHFTHSDPWPDRICRASGFGQRADCGTAPARRAPSIALVLLSTLGPALRGYEGLHVLLANDQARMRRDKWRRGDPHRRRTRKIFLAEDCASSCGIVICSRIPDSYARSGRGPGARQHLLRWR